MHIDCRYPEKITWVLDLTSFKDALELFGKKTQKKLKSSINRLKTTDYSFKIDHVDENFIKIFYPIYSKNVKQKKNPLVHDLMDKVILNPPHHFPYLSISLYEKDQLRGGIIFSDRDSFIQTSFRAFPSKIDLKLPISISYLAEYYLNDFCLKNNKEYICRGKDRNAFGANSSIGLVSFKLQLGYEPYMLNEEDFAKDKLQFFDSYEWDSESNVLIFEATQFSEKITSAVLLSLTATIDEKYQNILSSEAFEVKKIIKLP